MSSKVKNTVIILIIFVAITIVGGFFHFILQKGKINDRQKKIKELNLYQLDTDALTTQLKLQRDRVAALDSILANRKYNIPYKLSQSSFYDFVNQVSFNFSPLSHVNIEYNDQETTPDYNTYLYTLGGTAEFNDFAKLIYAIEESKMLKKITEMDISNNIKVDKDGTPHYLVTYKFKAHVLFSNENRFIVKDFKENKIIPNPTYDIFYPLVRNEIPPNAEKLLDVQTAHLLALIPDGAFLSDASGSTYLLWEGDQVYLGYLTNINYQNNEVNFVLNKGGIIENYNLKLEKENKSK
jgi:hypothetical protein